VLVAGLLAPACAGPGGVDLARLPDAPVALLQRSEEEALDRIDALGDLEKRKQPSDKEGVISLENLDGAFGGSPELQRRLQPHRGRLVLLDPRTGHTTPFEGAPPNAQPLSWSPDRTRLLLVGRWRDSAQLFVWARDTGTVDMVTMGPRPHISGCFTRDGGLVAGEVLDTQGKSRLVVTPSLGGSLSPLTEGPSDYRPSCSPSEPIVAFVRLSEKGQPSVITMTLDGAGGGGREVARGIHPVFSPDGQWIVYTAETTHGPRLFRVRPDGSGRTPLGAGLSDEGQPAVSPDGGYVAYVAVDSDRRERLWVRRFDGTGDRPLLSDGDGGMPTW
jgi:hypothetical protein